MHPLGSAIAILSVIGVIGFILFSHTALRIKNPLVLTHALRVLLKTQGWSECEHFFF